MGCNDVMIPITTIYVNVKKYYTNKNTHKEITTVEEIFLVFRSNSNRVLVFS